MNEYFNINKWMRTVSTIVQSYSSPLGGQIFIGSNTVPNLAFVSIHKNAHTWASHLLKTNLDFVPALPNQLKEFHTKHNAKYIVILRDPIERWISGFTQYSSKYGALHIEKLLSNTAFQEMVFDTLRFDSHTNLQVEYLLNIPVNRCVFFKQENNLEANFTHFISTLARGKELIPITDINIYHRRSTNLYKNRLGDKINYLVQNNDQFKTNIINYTAPDREFIEFVTKNNAWYNEAS